MENTQKMRPKYCYKCKKPIKKDKESYIGSKIYCQDCWHKEKAKKNGL